MNTWHYLYINAIQGITTFFSELIEFVHYLFLELSESVIRFFLEEAGNSVVLLILLITSLKLMNTWPLTFEVAR